MRHITYQFMEQHDFGPFLTTPAIYQYLEGVKNGYWYKGCSLKRTPPHKNQSASRQVNSDTFYETFCVICDPVYGNIEYPSQRQDLLLQPFYLMILNILIQFSVSDMQTKALIFLHIDLHYTKKTLHPS